MTDYRAIIEREFRKFFPNVPLHVTFVPENEEIRVTVENHVYSCVATSDDDNFDFIIETTRDEMPEHITFDFPEDWK